MCMCVNVLVPVHVAKQVLGGLGDPFESSESGCPAALLMLLLLLLQLLANLLPRSGLRNG